MSVNLSRADEIDLAKLRVEASLEDYRLGLLAYAEWRVGFCERMIAKGWRLDGNNWIKPEAA